MKLYPDLNDEGELERLRADFNDGRIAALLPGPTPRAGQMEEAELEEEEEEFEFDSIAFGELLAQLGRSEADTEVLLKSLYYSSPEVRQWFPSLPLVIKELLFDVVIHDGLPEISGKFMLNCFDELKETGKLGSSEEYQHLWDYVVENLDFEFNFEEFCQNFVPPEEWCPNGWIDPEDTAVQNS
jgi:hypothetical protein